MSRPVSRLHCDSSRNLDASEIMGAGTPVVLRSGPRPRLAEEAILLMDGDMGILMGATGPEPETRDERDGEQRPGRRDEEYLPTTGPVAI